VQFRIGLGVLVGLTAALGCARFSPPLEVQALESSPASFVTTLEGDTHAPIIPGHGIEILLNGDLFPALPCDTPAARRSITASEYVREKSGVGARLAQAPAARCRAGVGVDVLLDYTGSLGFPPEYGRALTDAGCRLAWSSR
jgi:hypothetical protein